MKSMERHAIGVIGSGLGGLSAACVLAARGYQVTVFEKNDWIGGKAAVLREGGYRFDMGPTILICPAVLRRVFAEAGRSLSDYLQLVPLEPQWRCFFEDKSSLDLYGNQESMEAELRRYSPEALSGYARFMATSNQLHSISDRFFFWRSVGSIRDTFETGSALKLTLLRDVARMKLGQTVSGAIRREIKDKRVAQMLDHLVQYVGSSPEKSPAILCAIAHMQASEGVWYPIGGTRAIPEALTKLATELGVIFRTNSRIRSIDVQEKRVHGVETTEGEYVPLGAVVANSDSVRTYRELIGGSIAEEFNDRRSYEPACSGVVMFLGLNRRYDHLAHHTFVFSRDPAEEFHAIYDKGEPAPDPTCYLCAPARTEAAVAPEGDEALYVLVHTPYLRPEHDWKEMYPKYRKVIFDKLKRTAGLHDLESAITMERYLTPQDIHERYGVLNGAIYGITSHGRLQGGFKPANHDPKVSGLYLAGGAAHPGPGMPMVLMSGWIAADRLDRDGVAERVSVQAAAV
ncbi:MAG: phytoene desaturase family protein [Acidobacteriota bacterium]|nr:phytoene desaturase family protein [Acidobacteriota bacterium]